MVSITLFCCIFFLVVFGTTVTSVQGTSSVNLNCRLQAVYAIGRACAFRNNSNKKRSIQSVPFVQPQAGLEESDYAGLPGQGISNGHQIPTGRQSVYGQNVPGFQQSAYPIPGQYNNFRGQQPAGQQSWQSPPQAMSPRMWPSHLRQKRTYDTGSQLARKCCGLPGCFEAELAALPISTQRSLCA